MCGALVRLIRTQLVPLGRGRAPPRPAVLHAWLAGLGGPHKGSYLPRRLYLLSRFRRPARCILLPVLIRWAASCDSAFSLLFCALDMVLGISLG